MNPPLRHTSLLNGAAAALVAVSAVLALRLGSALRSALPTAVPSASFRPDQASMPAPVPVSPEAWAALAPADSPRDGAVGELARRFRLAGTLFGFGVGSAETPQAILDDKLLVVQRLVRRSEEVLPGIRLVEVRSDAVVLEGPQGREELRLERALGEGTPGAPAARPAADGAGTGTGDADRLGGKQVFPGRWEFDRQRLLDYYAELRDEPERLLAVFDSMEPLYHNNDPSTRTITGYRLNVRGEAPLFEAMGIQPGDVVRSVNSVAMTNRRRAEGFIRAFVENEEDTFVLEVERNGTTAKQVYLVR